MSDEQRNPAGMHRRSNAAGRCHPRNSHSAVTSPITGRNTTPAGGCHGSRAGLTNIVKDSLAVIAPAELGGVGALIQRGGRAVAGMLTIATAGGS